MTSLKHLLAAASCIAAISSLAPAHATLISVSATDLTTVTNNNTGLGLDPHPGIQYSIGGGQDPASPLMRFDLSAYAGQSVNGPATLTMFVSDIWPFSTLTANFNLLALASGYNPNTVVGLQAGSLISTGTLTAASGASTPPGQTLTFQIAAPIVQSWINSPGSNWGLQLDLISYVSSAGHSDVAWGQLDNAAPIPLLTFNVPLPATLALFALGLAGLGYSRRKHAKTTV